MTDYEKILQMIKNVSPDDAAAMDEIDARVWCWLNGHEFVSSKKRQFVGFQYNPNDKTRPMYEDAPQHWAKQYTRSRDALKSIRPDGWVFTIDSRGWCRIWNTKNCNAPKIAAQNNKIGHLPTEELAELHAIIQAIQWERENETKT